MTANKQMRTIRRDRRRAMAKAKRLQAWIDGLVWGRSFQAWGRSRRIENGRRVRSLFVDALPEIDRPAPARYS
jgi:hypothetical protein